MAERALSTGESGSQFAALKKDFLFHEKRMQLLLSSSVVEGFNAAITEKVTTRDECADDCNATLRALSDASQLPSLSGRWNESVVASVLQLTIPLRDVIGSQLFEPTAKVECDDLKECILQLAEQSKDHAEFQQKKGTAASKATESQQKEQHQQEESKLVESCVHAIHPEALSSRDVRRMKDAVKSKLKVISELSHLSEALQKSGFQLAQERSEVCRLQEDEETANTDGEVAVAEELVEKRINALEKIIDIIFFRLHTVDATIDTNVTKRHSNLQTLQHTTVALEGVKREKQDAVQNCVDDIRRIDRSLQLQQVKEQTDSRGAELLAESERKLSAFEEKRKALTDRLRSLGAEFMETEKALAKLGVDRACAIDRHLDLIEQSRHVAADFAEMARFAQAHRKNLETTQARSDEGLDAVGLLERLLLQETDYMQYNFRASAQRLQNVRENVANELRSALRDYEVTIGEMLRRKQEVVLQLDEKIAMAECEAELRKDVFDPTAKKFVDKQRKLEDERAKITDEMCQLSQKLGQQVSSIKASLGEEFVSDTNNGSTAGAGAGGVTTKTSGGGGGGGGGGSSSFASDDPRRVNEAKQMVSKLRSKMLHEMAELEREAGGGGKRSGSTALNDPLSAQVRDVVDGVSRLTEDDDLHRRNIRKHERLLDQRQVLLEAINPKVVSIEERRELAALQQTVEHSAGYHQLQLELRQQQQQRDIDKFIDHSAVTPGGALNPYRSSPRKRGATAQEDNNNAVDSSNNDNVMFMMTPKPNINNTDTSIISNISAGTSGTAGGGVTSRAHQIRDEIRRAKSHASSSSISSPKASVEQQQRLGATSRFYEQQAQRDEMIMRDAMSMNRPSFRGGGGADPSSSSTDGAGAGAVPASSRRHGGDVGDSNGDFLPQVLVGDDDEDGDRPPVVSGSAAGAAKRLHPRVIGRSSS